MGGEILNIGNVLVDEKNTELLSIENLLKSRHTLLNFYHFYI